MNSTQTIFVFGFFPVSPGKTVVSTAICRGLLNRGFKVAPFKPRSGHNLWYQHDAFLRCREESRLYCEDIIKLSKASRCPIPNETLNPIDALLAPLDTRKFLEEDYIREMYMKEAITFHHLLVERYTLWRDGPRTILCVNENNLAEDSFVDGSYIRGLGERSDEVLSIADAQGWNSVFRRLGPECTSTCFRKIAEDHELMVVEGYNDAVCPAPGLRYDVVVGVAPGLAAFYDPDDFHRVIDVKSETGKEPMGMRAVDMIHFMKPQRVITVPALRGHDIKDFDTLSRKLDNIIDSVVEEFSEA